MPQINTIISILLSFISLLNFSKTIFGLLLSLELLSFNLIVFLLFTYSTSTVLCLTFIVCSSIVGICLILNSVLETNNSTSFSFIIYSSISISFNYVLCLVYND